MPHAPFEGPNETCVICLKMTDIPKTLHVDDPRRGFLYVEGLGQICTLECYNKSNDSVTQHSLERL